CSPASSLASVFAVQRTGGIAGVGASAVAANISFYANRVDEIVTDTIYPAICAVTDRADLLLESFLKSNRMALLWAVPLGLGGVLFAPDLVTFALGDHWRPAVFVIQAFALAAAVNQIGFNWTAFYRALGRTRPLAVAAGVAALSVLTIAVPLLLWKGVDGFGVGMGVATLVYVALRLVYLGRIFPIRAVVANTVGGIAPTLPALAAVLSVRALLGGGEREAAQVVGEVALFMIVVVGLTALLERELLQEFRAYLPRDRDEAAQPV
ncbi:MAG: oligosaccharide flippase family protein, partial [Thermoleophilaceae bacterium]